MPHNTSVLWGFSFLRGKTNRSNAKRNAKSSVGPMSPTVFDKIHSAFSPKNG